MSGFTIKNLMELDDVAADTSEVEARFARKHLDSEHLGLSYFRFAPGFRPGMGHTHKQQEEVYVVIGGSGRMKLGDEIVDLRQWDAVRVAPQTIRSMEAGPEGLELIVVGSDRPEEGDGEMVRDWWVD